MYRLHILYIYYVTLKNKNSEPFKNGIVAVYEACTRYYKKEIDYT